jgi:YVTN family beta-propeller protein
MTAMRVNALTEAGFRVVYDQFGNIQAIEDEHGKFLNILLGVTDANGNPIGIVNPVDGSTLLLTLKTTATGSLIVPSGTTAQRDPAPAAGYERYNTTTGTLEYYGGATWEQIVDAPMLNAGTLPASFTALSASSQSVSGSIMVGGVGVRTIKGYYGLLDYVGCVANTATITVGTGPYAVAYCPTNDRIYVSNYGGASVSVIIPSTGVVTATITVGTSPAGIAYCPTNDRIYVANNGGASVSILT